MGCENCKKLMAELSHKDREAEGMSRTVIRYQEEATRMRAALTSIKSIMKLYETP